MKNILVLLILFSAITLPALAELTDANLNQIRLIIRQEVKAEVKAEITASEDRMKEYINLKLENVNNQIKANSSEIGAIRSQMNVFIGIPLLIITLLFAWRALRDRANDKQIQALIAENEHLKRQQTITP
ncbi:MAG: hypothetical protein OXU36_15240 [Candidatus Poribacteria bacterium]|nr:hypothetical protein [Candidatus Poribacteria bacterium]